METSTVLSTAAPNLETEVVTRRLVLVGSNPAERNDDPGDGKEMEQPPISPVKIYATKENCNSAMNEPSAENISLQGLVNNFAKVLSDVTTQLESLNSFIRNSHAFLLKNNSVLSNALRSTGTPTLALVRLEGISDTYPSKQSRPQDNVSNVSETPRKVGQQQGRPDVTPTSKHSGDATCHQEGTSTSDAISISNILQSKRATLPKSLVDILDGSASVGNEGQIVRKNKNEAFQTSDAGQGDDGSYQFSIKQEEPKFKESPLNESKLGLLVLADAALKGSLSHRDSFKGTGSKTFPDSDSGRSTTGGSFNGSPCQSDTLRRKSHAGGLVYASQISRIARKRAFDSNRENILPHSPTNSDSMSSTSSSEAKSRKRRKVKQPLPCGYCGKLFNNQSSLRQHESFHRPARPFSCEHDKCEKAYKTRSELNRHLVVHSGEKKHFCKLCGKRFLRKQYLKTHLLRHHETGITMVTPTTGQDGSGAGDYKGEMSAPSVFVSQAEPLTWRCRLCFKIFVNNEDLSKHMRSYHEKKRSVLAAEQKCVG